MKYDAQKYEESLDLLALLAEILRKWKWLVCAILVGALVFGGVGALRKPEPVVDAEAVAAAQTARDGSVATLAADENELETNRATLADRETRIAADRKQLEKNEMNLLAQQALLEQLQGALERTQEVLNDPDADPERLSEIVVQLPATTNQVDKVTDRVEELAQKGRDLENEIAGWQTEISNLTARNDALETDIANLAAAIPGQEAALAAAQAGTPGSNNMVTNGVIGAILGVLVVCGAVFLRFLLGKKLLQSRELKERYSLPILGEFYSGSAKKHKGFDCWLDQLSGDLQTQPEEEQVYQLVAADIRAAAKEPKALAVTGTVPEEYLTETVEKLRALLPEDFAVTEKANPVYDASFLAEVREYSVLLVEAKGVSDRREIDKLAELLCRKEVDVLGAVVR